MADNPQYLVVKQEGITTDTGDVAAGDINKNEISVYFNQQYTGNTYLVELYDRLSADIQNSRKVEETCDILNDFIATSEDEVIGLEEKLNLGGMQAQTGYAKSCKERYVKNLAKYSMYETAQIIHAYLLGKVESGHAASVLPNLAKIQPEQKFELMRKAVLDPIENSIGKNPLGLHSKEVDGMAFFLTGKCKLKWEA